MSINASKVVLITGCDHGLGRYLLHRLLASGFTVIGTFLSLMNADEFHQLNSPDGDHKDRPSKFHPLKLDLRDRQAIKELKHKVQTVLDNDSSNVFHCLINNAGVLVMGEFHWQTEDQIDDQLTINILGTIHLTRQLLSILIKDRGHIVTVGSVNGLVGYPGLSVYSATKHALEGFMDSLRVEMRKFNVGVTLVRPGDIAKLTNILEGHRHQSARMWSAMSENERELYGDYFHAYHKSVLENTGLFSASSWERTSIWEDLYKRVLCESASGRYPLQPSSSSSSPPAELFSAPLLFRIIFTLIRWLPIAWRDALMALIVKRMVAKAN